jgi:hypothetical protein
LEEKDLKPAWLARQINYDADNLRKMLKNNRVIYPDLLFSISVVLDEDFFAVYSQKLKDIKNRRILPEKQVKYTCSNFNSQ